MLGRYNRLYAPKLPGTPYPKAVTRVELTFLRLMLSCFLVLISLYWRLVDLQYLCYFPDVQEKWVSYTYFQILSHTSHYRVLIKVPYAISRFLISYFICSNCVLCQSQSSNCPLLWHPRNHKFVFYTCVILFLFHKQVHSDHFQLPHISIPCDIRLCLTADELLHTKLTLGRTKLSP